jgi:hypothetical protein
MMTKKQKMDGVIEAVRYLPDGQVDWVRAYLRRGATFSDRVIISRKELVDRIKTGKNFAIGQREEYKASTFQILYWVTLKSNDDREWLVVSQADNLAGGELMDNLVGAPVL